MPPVRLAVALRRFVRSSWDHLGLVCAASFTVFGAAVAALAAALALVLALGLRGLAASAIAIAVVVPLVVAPLYGGSVIALSRAIGHEETAYTDVWKSAARVFGRAVALGSVELGVIVVLGGNVVFYASRGSLPTAVAAAIAAYALAFWLMCCVYHWPLLAAGDSGAIARDDGRAPGLGAVLRNGVVMAVSAPGFTLAVLVVLCAVLAVLAASGVGLALLAPGLAASLCLEAARHQLVRFGVLPPPEPEGPASDEPWRLR